MSNVANKLKKYVINFVELTSEFITGTRQETYAGESMKLFIYLFIYGFINLFINLLIY